MIDLLQATIIDWGSLGKTALVSLVAGTTVTLAFSLAILGATKATDLHRSGRAVAAAFSLAGAVFALAVSIAGIGVGLIAMINS